VYDGAYNIIFISQTNTFQAILATDGLQSFVIFLYADGEIQWTTGDASGGSGGLGGTPAQVGFNAGDGIRYAAIPQSRTNEILNIASTSNIGVPGIWVFRTDEDAVVIAGCDNLYIPGPSNEVNGMAVNLLNGQYAYISNTATSQIVCSCRLGAGIQCVISYARY